MIRSPALRNFETLKHGDNEWTAQIGQVMKAEPSGDAVFAVCDADYYISFPFSKGTTVRQHLHRDLLPAKRKTRGAEV